MIYLELYFHHAITGTLARALSKLIYLYQTVLLNINGKNLLNKSMALSLYNMRPLILNENILRCWENCTLQLTTGRNTKTTVTKIMRLTDYSLKSGCLLLNS